MDAVPRHSELLGTGTGKLGNQFTGGIRTCSGRGTNLDSAICGGEVLYDREPIDSAVILAWIFDIPVEDLFVLNDSDEGLDEENRKVTACK